MKRASGIKLGISTKIVTIINKMVWIAQNIMRDIILKQGVNGEPTFS